MPFHVVKHRRAKKLALVKFNKIIGFHSHERECRKEEKQIKGLRVWGRWKCVGINSREVLQEGTRLYLFSCDFLKIEILHINRNSVLLGGSQSQCWLGQRHEMRGRETEFCCPTFSMQYSIEPLFQKECIKILLSLTFYKTLSMSCRLLLWFVSSTGT